MDARHVRTLAAGGNRVRRRLAHLARTFRRYFGSSPGAYLRTLRVERARVALATTRDAIATIALDAGFANQAHFTRTFHRQVGLPPAAYRRRYGSS